MQFEFATAGSIRFGAGRLPEAGPAVRAWGRRVLVVGGKNADRSAALRRALSEQGLEWHLYSVAAEPTVEVVEAGVALARQAECEAVVAMGGGSVLDAGKAIAGLAPNPGHVLDYLEVVGRGQPLAQPGIPCLAVPTTAGTGAEVTRNAVLTVRDRALKASLRSPWLLPRMALVDPALTCDLPPEVTAATGMDALTQLIEAFVSVRANPITDAFCREGLSRMAAGLRRVYEDGTDAAARADVALASLLSGLALANGGLGAVHGLAAPLGGAHAMAHGAVCAALLPEVMAANLAALESRAPHHAARARFDEIGRLLCCQPEAGAADGIEWVRETRRRLRVRPLGALGFPAEAIEDVARHALSASSMKGNPAPLTLAELTEVLARAL